MTDGNGLIYQKNSWGVQTDARVKEVYFVRQIIKTHWYFSSNNATITYHDDFTRCLLRGCVSMTKVDVDKVIEETKRREAKMTKEDARKILKDIGIIDEHDNIAAPYKGVFVKK